MNTWQASYRICKQMPGRYALIAVLWGAVHMTPLLPGLITREFFNVLSGEAAVGWSVWTLLALLVGIGVGHFINLLVAVATYVPFRIRVSGGLQRNMLREILRHPGAAALPTSPGAAVSRFRGDVREITMFTGDRVVDVWGLLLGPIIGLSVLFSINARITLGVVMPLVVVIALVNVLRKRLERYRTASRKAAGRVTGFIGEMYGAVQAVKVANAEADVNRHLAGLNERRRRAALKDTLLSELLHTSFLSTVQISMGIILILAGQAITDGTFTVGDFALFVAYLWPITDGLTFIGNMLAVQKQTDVSLNRMAALVQNDPTGAHAAQSDDEEEEHDSALLNAYDAAACRPDPAAYDTLLEGPPIALNGAFPPIPYTPKSSAHRLHAIHATGLTYRYPGTGRGIADINLYLPRGSFTVVTGRIGSGKTTLLRVLLGLLPLDAGEVTWNGQIVEQRDTFFVPPRAAYAGQVPRLFSDTLRNNILLGMPDHAIDMETALHTAVLEKDLLDLEDGLETVVGPRGVKLSGGQIQRTATARMLARRPELYVFDDLSSALDVETEKTLWERLFAQQDETDHQPTCLVVSHRRAALQRADHILVLQDGCVEAEGSLSELLSSSDEMRRLWEGNGHEMARSGLQRMRGGTGRRWLGLRSLACPSTWCVMRVVREQYPDPGSRITFSLTTGAPQRFAPGYGHRARRRTARGALHVCRRSTAPL